MDDFELQLKSVVLAGPSQQTRERIFGKQPARGGLVDFFRSRVPLGWAATFALFTGLAGMYASQFLQAPPAPPMVQNIQIFEAPSGEGNPWDLTQAAEWMPQGDMSATLRTDKEI